MVLLRVCLILVMALAVLGKEQEFGKIFKNLDKLGHHKKQNEVIKDKPRDKFSILGKFKQAVIGSIPKFRPGAPSPPKQGTGKVTTETPPVYRQLGKQVLDKEIQEDASDDARKKVIDQKTIISDKESLVAEELHNLITTPGVEKNNSSNPTASSSLLPATSVPSQEDPSPATATSNLKLSQADALNNANIVPSPLGLTSDTHHKRAGIHDLPEGDGLFLVVVLCVAVCCILGVVGVGYCVHHPTCPRPSSPFSDSSPSFHSAQLAFSSSPEVLTGDSQGKVQPGQASRCPGQADARSGGASRAHKFRSGAGGLGQVGGAGAGMIQKRSVPIQRMESLIDIDGPEEDDEDDMIYECPGLAPHGEMEVTNPFFLSKELDMDLERMGGFNTDLLPCPVNNNNNMRHGNIHRNIQPGQQ